jgi:hypothetical protein
VFFVILLIGIELLIITTKMKKINFGVIALVLGIYLGLINQLQKEVWGLGGRYTEYIIFILAATCGVTSLVQDRQNNWRKIMAVIGLLLSLAWLFYGYYRPF